MEKIIGAVIGLIGAIGNHGKKENTDYVLMEALAFCAPAYSGADLKQEQIDAMYQKVLAEKERVSPACSSCGVPCGGTSDYDMSKIAEDSKALQELKRAIISHVCMAAADFMEQGVDLSDLDIITNQMYTCLACIGQDADYEMIQDEYEVMKLLYSLEEE